MLLIRLSLLLILLVQPLAASFYIAQPVVNLSKGPNEKSRVGTQVNYGTQVELLGEEGDWLYVETPDPYRGYLPRTACVYRQESYPSGPLVARVNSLYSHFYWEPDLTRRAPAITLPFGSAVEIVSPDEGQRWLLARLIDGRELYVQRGDLLFNARPLSMEEMLTLSHRFLGLPYTWAGKSSFGFDCSGFVQTLYGLMGISLPRNSRDQSLCGRLVSRDELQPGDLLFFGQEGKVSHVALYLGDGVLIQAAARIRSGAPVVRIDRVEEQEACLPYISARRLL